MIPKIAHMVWLGNTMPPLYDAMRRLFVTNNPDWELRVWTDADIASLEFGKVARRMGRVAFASDVVRYEVLRKYGGHYRDFDVFSHRSVTPWMQSPIAAEEMWGVVCNAWFGVAPEWPGFTHLLESAAKLTDSQCHSEDTLRDNVGVCAFTAQWRQSGFSTLPYKNGIHRLHASKLFLHRLSRHTHLPDTHLYTYAHGRHAIERRLREEHFSWQ